MKPETMQRILDLLKQDMYAKKENLMLTIENQTGNLYIDERIQEYRAARNAYNDFEDWIVEQEDQS